MPLAKKRLHRLLREVTVPRADVDNQRIGRLTGGWHRLAHTLINCLADQMLHHGAMYWIRLNGHIESLVSGKKTPIWNYVNKKLAKTPKSFHILRPCRQKKDSF